MKLQLVWWQRWEWRYCEKLELPLSVLRWVWRRRRGHGGGPVVAMLMMVVVQKVDWNLFFEGVRMICFHLFFEGVRMICFCTRSSRRILRGRSFVVRATSRWRMTDQDEFGPSDRVRPILVRLPRNLKDPWRSLLLQSMWRNRRPQAPRFGGASSVCGRVRTKLLPMDLRWRVRPARRLMSVGHQDSSRGRS